MRKFVLVAAFGLWSAAAGATSSIEGYWLTDDHKGLVRIGACGRQLCGWIARVLDNEPGVPTHDVNNPNPALRARPITGMQTLSGFMPGAAGQYRGGRAYDPQSGRSYRASLALNPDGSLSVTGCLLFICQTKHWLRVR